MSHAHVDPKTIVLTGRPDFSFPMTWGPLWWRVMLDVAAATDRANTAHNDEVALVFFYALQMLIPCVSCAESYNRHLTARPPERRIASWLDWVAGIKNMVNLDTGAPWLDPRIVAAREKSWTAFSSPSDFWDFVRDAARACALDPALANAPALRANVHASRFWLYAILSTAPVWLTHVRGRDTQVARVRSALSAGDPFRLCLVSRYTRGHTHDNVTK